MLCSVLFTVQMTLYMAIVVYAPALAIAQGKLKYVFYINYVYLKQLSVSKIFAYNII